MPGIGFGIAATPLVGQSLGARSPAEARAAAGIATRWAMILSASTSACACSSVSGGARSEGWGRAADVFDGAEAYLDRLDQRRSSAASRAPPASPLSP